MNTIILIHGLWVTPLSWDKFKRRYEAQGYTVLAPAWPGVEGSPAEMRRDASSLHGVGAEDVIEHYARIIRELPEPPIIMGHSYGGLVTQALADRGLGAAVVAIDSVPPKGIYLLPFSTYGALTGALANPLNYRSTFIFSFPQWWRVFANTLTEADARREYEAQVIPASGRAIFQAALANVTPGASTAVNFRNPARPPMLVVGGEKDVIMPAALSRKIFRRHRASSAVTEYKEFAGRSHYIIAEQGWEEVADFALAWATDKVARTSVALRT
ncbi:MAG: alpha/beta hydrolase [Opitutaceae bacterium]|nr:alpha/beta hydrolase [Opitutaceae bacterium]